MPLNSPLEQWAAEVGAAASTLATYYRTAGSIAQLHTPYSWTPPDAPQNVQATRSTLLNTTTKIQQAIVEPGEYLQRLAVNVCSSYFCLRLSFRESKG
jgi:hypothetical protein